MNKTKRMSLSTRVGIPNGHDDEWIRLQDAKEAIKELKKDFEIEYGKEESKRMKGIISERFGDKLS